MALQTLGALAAQAAPAVQGVVAVASGTAQGVLNESVLQAVTQGFSSLEATVTQVIGISVPVSVSVIALTGGVRYALKKVRGVISSAA